MKERPIIFSGPMVRALLDGSKTQTRRVAKYPIAPHFCEMQEGGVAFCEWEGTPCCGTGVWEAPYHSAKVTCPYGQPGDRLWVRETFYCDNAFYPDGVGINSMWRTVDGQRIAIPVNEQRAEMLDEDMYYRADGEPAFEGTEGPTPWRPSIHMPRWTSRITLEVTDVRVERLDDISESDARAEGVTIEERHKVGYCVGADRPPSIRAYRELWDSLNAERGYGWDTNPWVWVVEFRIAPTQQGERP